MNERDEYRLKLRTPKKQIKTEPLLWGNSSPVFDLGGFSAYSTSLNTPSPTKTKYKTPIEASSSYSPGKSSYFLRTPSPPLKLYRKSPQRANSGLKTEISCTVSPHKVGPATDLFGNRSLLENLPIPEWDDHFLDNFQEELLFGLGSEDLEGLVRSPLTSPRRGQTFLGNSPFKRSPSAISPFKSPLLTSSPKLSLDSPSNLIKTPDLAGGRHLTRQRKLFLQSPEHQKSSQPNLSNWSMPLPLSGLDETSSSVLSDSRETTTSIQSISNYLKQLDDDDDDDDNVDDYPAVPPAGWTSSKNSNVKIKSVSKGIGKSSKHNRNSSSLFSSSTSNMTVPKLQAPSYINTGGHTTSDSKKVKIEPQFTLLWPHAELHNNQISLRMTPRTPPNKIKISRDFSQIQTLPSKEQLQIVRSRFRETLNKAVEQHIEKERAKQAEHQENKTNPSLHSALQQPLMLQPVSVASLPTAYNIHGHAVHKPPMKKRKR